ncbi:SMP-30/gluconolactonase/LRE family protein [Photobacterium sp. MCCC 1A19761]|uniref:SMP-30/gluconolactonase/LRE family protein n=1 Tax=Photobacterium sp. MCCC 1A19761 TaxID=3115000 RepID=UPI00307D1627
MMGIKVLKTPASELGEGVFLDKMTQKLYWLDIVNNNLYQYSLREDKLINTFALEGNPSCIFSVSDESLTYVNNVGVKQVNLIDGTTKLQVIHSKHCPKKLRANDGVVLSDSSIIYGTMGYSPEVEEGKIYRLDKKGRVNVYELGVRIPNTFIEFDNKLLVSDSLKQRIYEIDLIHSQEPQLRLWKDFSSSNYTPDGGCLSERGYVHVALWDGSAIAVMDENGKVVRKVDLPVLRPTNCIIYANRWLYVTSAYEGMTEAQLEKYPLSGKTLEIDLGSNYDY